MGGPSRWFSFTLKNRTGPYLVKVTKGDHLLFVGPKIANREVALAFTGFHPMESA